MQSRAESPIALWSAPQCPFSIEYSTSVLDDVRLAVVDAFYSLPRGGAEIGGVLLGAFVAGRLTISSYLALDCEHAFGPSFVLSAADIARLDRLLASAEARAGGLTPVGWYHSHTRSEIFLSEADQEIHNRYFPKPWQVALVLKPHTFMPMRAGFFFREADGALHGKSCYSELVLEPLAIRPLPGTNGMEEPPLVARTNLQGAAGEVITLISKPEEAPAPPPLPEPEPQPEIAIPAFLAPQQRRSWRWLKSLAAVAVGMAVGSIGFQKRDMWLPPLIALWHPEPVKAASLGLAAMDENGQLQIRWNGDGPLVRDGAGAVLQIVDGPASPKPIALDNAHLRSGSFTYQRQSQRVDVALIVGHGGNVAKEATSFIGKLPEPAAPVADPGVIQERDELARTNAKLESDLRAEVDRRKKLERSLAEARNQLRAELKRRLGNQDK